MPGFNSIRPASGARLAHIKIPVDLGGIVVHPGTGMLRIVVEGDDVILELDPDAQEFSMRFPVNRAFGGNPDFLRKQVEGYDSATLCFDASGRVLCVVSDTDNVYVEIGLDGTLVAEYAFPEDNQEGLTWDSEGHLYIARDFGGIPKVRELRQSPKSTFQRRGK